MEGRCRRTELLDGRTGIRVVDRYKIVVAVRFEVVVCGLCCGGRMCRVVKAVGIAGLMDLGTQEISLTAIYDRISIWIIGKASR